MNPVVLIVDDSLTVRMYLAASFESAGFTVLECATLAAARALLAERTVSLAVLDVLLPDGDGVDLLMEIRATPATAELPVMLLSSEAEVRDRVRGLRTGAQEYVGKPYEPGFVLSRAHQLVRGAGRAAADPERRQILVIDDSETFREELRAQLTSSGYGVTTAPTGEEGLRLAAELQPTLVLVDGVLPGIDGATVIRRLRQDAGLRRTPCLLLTAAGDSGAELGALDAGADAYLRKDEGVAVILARVAALLRSATAQPAQRETTGFLGPKRILAVDDSPTFLHELADHLRSEGYDVVLAASGEEALELLVVQPVDCILLDLMLPGLSGHETCRRIKAHPTWREIPLVMLTALGERGAMIEGINAGADDYIAKSPDFEVVRARLRAQLRRKQFEDENRRIRGELAQREREAAEAKAAQELAETRAVLLRELEERNSELEAFSHSVSHDLRAPLRAIQGFNRLLLEDCAAQLDAAGREYLQRIDSASTRMDHLIRDLLSLARVDRAQAQRQPVDLSALAREVEANLRNASPERRVIVGIAPGLTDLGDPGLLRIVLENLLGNAWKFTSKRTDAHIDFVAVQEGSERRYRIRDDGAGFDPQYAERLFRPFQRLHSQAEFAGTGIGLTTVHRIVRRHRGRIWAEGSPGRGAAFYFTLGTEPEPSTTAKTGQHGSAEPRTK